MSDNIKDIKATEYPNFFKELGYSDKEAKEKLNKIFDTLFYGSEDERIYHPVGSDMGYIEDTGNIDARTEGMSYGMMMCVQLDKKEEFDRIWKWARTYMYLNEGRNKGFFCWSNSPSGTKNADGAAPDGEEYFAMALLFASHRWGDGEGIFNYGYEARRLLHDMIRPGDEIKKPEGKDFEDNKDKALNGECVDLRECDDLRECVDLRECDDKKQDENRDKTGRGMFDRDNHLIRFICEVDFTDPSYHLPHFYELFALWADPCDREFYKTAAKESRSFLHKACHPVSGLTAEYSYYDGKPFPYGQDIWGKHDWYYSDAYRTIMNIALDHIWFNADPWQVREGELFLDYFVNAAGENNWDRILDWDGTIREEKVLHPVAVIATNAAAAALVLDDGGEGKDVCVMSCEMEDKYNSARFCLEKFWNTPLRTGNRRYYDNCLYLFSFMLLSGNYRIW